MADVISVLDSPRLAIAAVAPIGAAIGVTALGCPVAHPLALLIAPVVVALIYGYAAQNIAKKPWKSRFGKLASIVALAASGLGLALVVAPWTAVYDDRGFYGLQIGFVITGTLVSLALGPVYIVMQRRGAGPFKKLIPAGGYVMTFLWALMIGPIIGAVAALPMILLWTNPVLQACPAALSPATWMTALGVLACMAIAALWIGVDAINAWDKQQRKAILHNAGLR